MRKSIPIDIVGSTKFDRYRKQSVETTYNMLISDDALVPYAGYQKVLEILPGRVESREIYRSVKYEHLFVVLDEFVYEIDDNFGYTIIGQLETRSGPVFIDENNSNQIAFVDGLYVYIYDYGLHEFTRVTVDFEPGYITFQDTYFIAADISSNQWRLSESGNGKSWPSLPDVNASQFIGELQTKPDLMVAAIRFNRQLFIMGTKTVEIWHDVGGTLFPYQRDNTLSIDYGCLSASTIASGFGLLVWLAANEHAGPTIRVSTGGAPEEISNDGINFALDKLTKPEDSTAFLFEEDGHVFYQITFRSDNQTFVYDFNTKAFFNVTNEHLGAHIAKRMAFFNNHHYFVANEEGALYNFGTEYTSFNTSLDGTIRKAIPRIRLTKPIRMPDASRFCMTNMNITLEQGEESTTQYFYISKSTDGGATFGNAIQKQLNDIGNRPNRLRQMNLGSANDCVFQFRMESLGRFVVLGATMDITQ